VSRRSHGGGKPYKGTDQLRHRKGNMEPNRWNFAIHRLLKTELNCDPKETRYGWLRLSSCKLWTKLCGSKLCGPVCKLCGTTGLGEQHASQTSRALRAQFNLPPSQIASGVMVPQRQFTATEKCQIPVTMNVSFLGKLRFHYITSMIINQPDSQK